MGVCGVGGSRPVYVLASTVKFENIDMRFGNKLSGSEESSTRLRKKDSTEKEFHHGTLAPMMLTLFTANLSHCQFETIAI